jgi:hypothetical protein
MAPPLARPLWLRDDVSGGLGDCAMDSVVSGLAETDEDVLTIDVPDDALERAAGIPDGRAFTLAYCTHDWVACGWPM